MSNLIKSVLFASIPFIVIAFTVSSYLPMKEVSRGPALEKSYQPLKKDVLKFLVAYNHI